MAALPSRSLTAGFGPSGGGSGMSLCEGDGEEAISVEGGSSPDGEDSFRGGGALQPAGKDAESLEEGSGPVSAPS